MIADSIVSDIRKLNPPGRFLKRDSNTRRWQSVDDGLAVEKALQALREKSKDRQNQPASKATNKSITEPGFMSTELGVKSRAAAIDQDELQTSHVQYPPPHFYPPPFYASLPSQRRSDGSSHQHSHSNIESKDPNQTEPSTYVERENGVISFGSPLFSSPVLFRNPGLETQPEPGATSLQLPASSNPCTAYVSTRTHVLQEQDETETLDATTTYVPSPLYRRFLLESRHESTTGEATSVAGQFTSPGSIDFFRRPASSEASTFSRQAHFYYPLPPARSTNMQLHARTSPLSLQGISPPQAALQSLSTQRYQQQASPPTFPPPPPPP